ncbi:hypothetical protein N7481_004853 [Penicillium waksmanii]|uniref:uncharacterized protein n=1 Tax=Penicillium waksmanii TaxID=69791 RepID=UPI002547A433|nr:uncharacterized protein N7481_004853 [Penicillium waksmanii]KAJ5989643.1 hypothetical protein N7481_004853 [Penicillium waksmanii]
MTTEYYPMAQWPAHPMQMAEPQLITQEELDQQALMDAGFPMQTDFEQYLPQLDEIDQLDWNSEMAGKQTFLPPYPQSWYEAGLVSDQRKQLEASWKNGFMMPEYQTMTPTATYHDAENDLLSRTASERALFMTPPAQPHYYPTFPGSPISELCSTPEMSHSSHWESEYEDKERDRETYTRSPYTAPEPHRLENEAGDYFSRGVDVNSHVHVHVDESECETVLEMPDGTTRRTANWLPVDSSAGFTIGPEQRGLYKDRPQMEFEDIQGGFFHEPCQMMGVSSTSNNLYYHGMRWRYHSNIDLSEEEGDSRWSDSAIHAPRSTRVVASKVPISPSNLAEWGDSCDRLRFTSPHRGIRPSYEYEYTGTTYSTWILENPKSILGSKRIKGLQPDATGASPAAQPCEKTSAVGHVNKLLLVISAFGDGAKELIDDSKLSHITEDF